MIPRLQDSYDPIRVEDLELLQKRLGLTLPVDYKDFLLAHNGGGYFSDNVTFPMPYPAPDDSGGVFVFYHLGTDIEPGEVEYEYNESRDWLPEGYLPISDDGCGNPVCLCASGIETGTVYVWREKPYGPRSELLPVAPRLQQFLASLRVEEDEPSETIEVFQAAEKGNDYRLQELLAAGTSVDVRNERGATLLMVAANSHRVHTVNLLLKIGADLEAKDNKGCESLYYAAVGHSYDCAKALLANGAALDSRDDLGRTVLMSAILVASVRVARLLIANGADVNAKSLTGETPLSCCSVNAMMNERLVPILKSAGARE